MNTLIILAHPYEKSFCATIAETVVKASNNPDFIYLDKDNFNPVMSGQELLAWRQGEALDPQVLDYQRRVKAADHLVLIFPIWWEAMPAIMKGFIDKVIIKKFAYIEPKDKWRWKNQLTNIKQVTMITGISTPKFAYKLFFSNAIYKIVLRGVFNKIGIKKVKWFNIDTSRNIPNEKRTKELVRVADYFTDERYPR